MPLNSKKLYSEEEKIKYILENIKVELIIDKEKSTKKINKFFEKEAIINPYLYPQGVPRHPPLDKWGEKLKIEFWLQDWRSWKEAKATGWWIDINELDNNMQSKNNPWLYFIWEVIDITWKTWWFNLQWAWSSGYVCGKSFE